MTSPLPLQVRHFIPDDWSAGTHAVLLHHHHGTRTFSWKDQSWMDGSLHLELLVFSVCDGCGHC